MRRFEKRFWALLLVLMLFMTSFSTDVYANNTDSIQNQEDASYEETSAELEDEAEEDAVEETTSEENVDCIENADSTDIVEDCADSVSQNDIELIGEKNKLNYIYVDKKYLSTHEDGEEDATEYILASFGDEETEIQNATLTIENCDTKAQITIDSDESLGNLIMFSREFVSEDSGIYQVISTKFTTISGEVTIVDVSETGMSNIYFGVDEIFEEVAEGESVETIDPEIELQIVDMESGEIVGENTAALSDAVEDALENAEENLDNISGKKSNTLADFVGQTMGTVAADTSTGNYVVVLDPGHDSTHTGASANGLREEVLNLKIAQYCKAELEKYAGVTVYMTRNSSACPNGGTKTEDNERRVAYAKSVGANLYVSIHLNSGEASASGAEVYYPNSNYNSTIGSKGANLATLIERQLVALGLYNRGIKVRNSGDNTRYSDGSLADYYGVIRLSKISGFPAVIVEHAFVTNTSDANYLKSEDNLKKLGVADAQGIAQYLGVGQSYDVKSNAPTINQSNNAAGTCTVSVTGVSPANVITGVTVAVWSDKNGQDDLQWYSATNKGNGTYSASIDIAKHNREAGAYSMHVYATDNRGDVHWLGAVGHTFTAVPVTGKIESVKQTADGKNIEIIATGVSGVSNLNIAVWSNANGQDDLQWYSATANQTAADKTAGTYTYKVYVPIANHRGQAGYYSIHAYGNSVYYGSKLVGTSQFYLEPPKITKAYVTNTNSGAGTFDIKIEDVKAPSGVSKIDVAVWSEGNQSNLNWYQATLDTTSTGKDGIRNDYIVKADLANHSYMYGTYNAHCYLTDNNGVSGFAATSVSITRPQPSISVDDHGTQSVYTINLKNATWVGGINSIDIAVWSDQAGQDDLQWYTAKKLSAGTYAVDVPISNHRSTGGYQAHVYVKDNQGNSHYMCATKFSVRDIGAKVTGRFGNQDLGMFEVDIDAIDCPAGIDKIDVAIWSESNQSNLNWYRAEYVKATSDRNGDGKVNASDDYYKVGVSIANHKYKYGTYNMHAYIYGKNGVFTIKTGSYTLKNPTPIIKCMGNASESSYQLYVSNVGQAGGVTSIDVAVWSDANGQDDLRWYAAEKQADGSWKVPNIDVAHNHKSSGKYQAHIYAKDPSGTPQLIGTTSFNVTPMSIGTMKLKSNKAGDAAGTSTSGVFDVSLSGFSAKAGIDHVSVAVWSKPDQSDLKWYELPGNSAEMKTTINIMNHNYNAGTYTVHAYVYAKNGLCNISTGSIIVKNPDIHVQTIVLADESGALIKSSDVSWFAGVRDVQFAVWSDANGQDDFAWYRATKDDKGVWSVCVPTLCHKTAGDYTVHAYLTDGAGNMHCVSSSSYKIKGPTSVQSTIVNKVEDDGRFQIKVNNIVSAANISKVTVGVWSDKNGMDDFVWYPAYKQANGDWITDVNIRNHASTLGNYSCHIYAEDVNGVSACVGAISTQMNIYVNDGLYPIMGASSVTVDQMVAYYNRSGKKYPSYYAGSDAPDIRTFCQIYLDECNAEGIKAEVAFCQAMKETGFLQYGGDVKIEQYNFAGLGATGGGARGVSFASVRQGIRAQVQHLKAYATTAPLKNACVDSRYQYVSKGSAPYVEWLGQHENPQGKGWATAVNYGYSIVNGYIAKLLAN